MRLFQRPETAFLLAAFLLLLLAFWGPRQAMDFHVHDTYFVVEAPARYLLPSIGLFLFWIIYSLARRILLSGFLTWFHVIATLIFPVALFCCSPGLQRRFVEIHSLRNYGLWLQLMTIVFLLGQLAFLVNMIAGALRALFGNTPPETKAS